MYELTSSALSGSHTPLHAVVTQLADSLHRAFDDPDSNSIPYHSILDGVGTLQRVGVCLRRRDSLSPHERRIADVLSFSQALDMTPLQVRCPSIRVDIVY